MNEYIQYVSDYLKEQDDFEVGLGDTLDIKTSIALVVIIFLATQSAEFLKSPFIPLHWRSAQFGSAICLILAGVLALWELWPREYAFRLGSTEFLNFVEERKAFHREEGEMKPEDKVIEYLRDKDVQRAKDRFANNSRINSTKLFTMRWSFYFTTVALALNLATLLALSFGWRF